ncbi:MAG TPA: ATP-binding protein [Bacteroidia bacterium]|nr:ATP-binding protein [Bacteroidia bacterium]
MADLSFSWWEADGVAYVLVVLITMSVSGILSTCIAGAAGVIFVIVGCFVVPHENMHESAVMANRVLSCLGIAASTLLVIRYKRSAAELFRQKENLDAVFRFATEGIIVADEKGRIVRANPRTALQFGYSPGELPGKPVEDLMPARYRDKHAGQRSGFMHAPSSRSMGERNVVLFGKRKDGTEFPVEIGLTSYKIREKRFAVAFVIDISERYRQQEELRKTHLELKASNEELETFAFVASHDLQEPLRKIRSFSERLKDKEAERLSETGLDYLNRIANAGRRMQNLINDLLAYSRLTTRAKEFSVVDLDALLRDTLSDMEISIGESKAKINIVSPLPSLLCDATQIRQVLQNLLSNAIKFRKPGVAPEITIGSQRDGKYPGYYAITISDNGIGFDEKHTKKIFGFFERLENSKYEGTGIGLAVVKKIMSRHEGMIKVKSEPGKGSSFTLLFPEEREEKGA